MDRCDFEEVGDGRWRYRWFDGLDDAIVYDALLSERREMPVYRVFMAEADGGETPFLVLGWPDMPGLPCIVV